MALTLTDLQTYTGVTYANPTKAQAKLDIAINMLSTEMCMSLVANGYVFTDKLFTDTTGDYISVNATPSRGGTGTITLTKLTTRNATITPTLDGALRTLTDAAPIDVITGLGNGTYTVVHDDFTWTVIIGENDVNIMPYDTTTGQVWMVYDLGDKNIRLNPFNDLYKAYRVDCEDKVVAEYSDYTFDGFYVTLCNGKDVNCICSTNEYRIAILADWYIPADLETIAFDMADAMISIDPKSSIFNREEIGSYSYTRNGKAVAESILEENKSIINKYSLCRIF